VVCSQRTDNKMGAPGEKRKNAIINGPLTKSKQEVPRVEGKSGRKKDVKKKGPHVDEKMEA